MKKSATFILSIMLIMAVILPASAFSTIAVKGIKLDKSAITLKVGQSYTLKVTLTPKNTTQKKLTYITANKNIATIDTTGKIKGIGKGTTTITVYTQKKNISAKCKVTVTKTSTVAMPVQKKPVVVMWLESRQSNTEDVTLVHDYIEKKSGVKYVVNSIASAEDYITKVNIMLASGTDLDLIYLQAGDIKMNNMVSRGSIQKLNEVIDRYGLNIKKVYDDECWQAVTDSKGAVWAIPSRGWGFGSLVNVRKDWREKSGIGEIKTIADLEKYLKAVRVADFDKNGKDDTIPLTTFGDTTKTLRGYDALFKTLGYCVIEDVCTEGNFLDKDGKVKPVYMHPKYKDFVALLSKWHKEGLLNPELYATKADQVNDLIIANKVGATADWYSSYIRPWDKLKKEVDPGAVYEYISPQTLSGKPYKYWRQEVGTPCLGVVSYSKNAEWAIKLLDWMVSSEDNYWTTKRGLIGVHWEWIDKSKGTFKNLKGDDLTKSYNYAEGLMSVYGNGNVHWEDRASNPDNVIAHYYKARDWMFEHKGYTIPDWFVKYDFKGTSVDLSKEEGETLMGEGIIKMILGQKSLSDWDSLITEYRKVHADKYIELANQQYQRDLPKK